VLSAPFLPIEQEEKKMAKEGLFNDVLQVAAVIKDLETSLPEATYP